MNSIRVVNVKCSGCANTIKNELGKIGITNIEVGFSDIDSSISREVKFDGDLNLVKNTLTSLGYPEVGSIEAKSVLKKAKSFVSCAIGKMG